MDPKIIKKKPQTGPGAPKGNQNALGTGSNPWTSFFKRRILRDEDSFLEKSYARYLDELRSDLPDPSGMEERIIELAATSRVCWLLAYNELDKGNIAAERCLEIGKSYISLELSCLSKLGKRRSKVVDDPMKSLRRIADASS